MKATTTTTSKCFVFVVVGVGGGDDSIEMRATLRAPLFRSIRMQQVLEESRQVSNANVVHVNVSRKNFRPVKTLHNSALHNAHESMDVVNMLFHLDAYVISTQHFYPIRLRQAMTNRGSESSDRWTFAADEWTNYAIARTHTHTHLIFNNNGLRLLRR